jgi:hypothetical protein
MSGREELNLPAAPMYVWSTKYLANCRYAQTISIENLEKATRLRQARSNMKVSEIGEERNIAGRRIERHAYNVPM